MEKTFEELYTDLQTATGDYDTVMLGKFKNWINRGLTVFQGKLPGKFTEEMRYTNSVANQEQYQRPENTIRIIDITYYDGSTYTPLEQITDNTRWQWIRNTPQTGRPVYYHLVGEDLYEVYPKPSTSVTAGLRLNVKIRQKPMYAPNYTTGTISIPNGSITVTGVGTTFTSAMVGRKLKISDASNGDGVWYRISGFTSTTSIQLENFYAGNTIVGGTFTIAEIPSIPVELSDTLHDYGLWRYNVDKKDYAAAKELKAIWEIDLELIGRQYKDDTEQQVFPPNSPSRIDVLTAGIFQEPRNIT